MKGFLDKDLVYQYMQDNDIAFDGDRLANFTMKDGSTEYLSDGDIKAFSDITESDITSLITSVEAAQTLSVTPSSTSASTTSTVDVALLNKKRLEFEGLTYVDPITSNTVVKDKYGAGSEGVYSFDEDGDGTLSGTPASITSVWGVTPTVNVGITNDDLDGDGESNLDYGTVEVIP